MESDEIKNIKEDVKQLKNMIELVAKKVNVQLETKVESKPEYTDGDWLYFENCTDHDNTYYGICRFKSYNDRKLRYTEAYHISMINNVYQSFSDGYYDVPKWISDMKLATPDQICKCLSTIAKKKGFKAGIKIRSKITRMEYNIRNDYVLYDILLHKFSMDHVVIYSDDGWAEILNNVVVDGHEAKVVLGEAVIASHIRFGSENCPESVRLNYTELISIQRVMEFCEKINTNVIITKDAIINKNIGSQHMSKDQIQMLLNELNKI